jgi:hypothetical protein
MTQRKINLNDYYVIGCGLIPKYEDVDYKAMSSNTEEITLKNNDLLKEVLL